ncbi:MAG TPA: hypothetical protein VIK62_02935 [Verrucomicrobiae bacterium]
MKSLGKSKTILAGSPLANFFRGIFTAIIFSTAAVSLPAAEATNTYAKWIKPWMEQPAISPTLNGAGLKLVVTSVRGEVDEATVTAMTPVQRIYLSYHLKVAATEVATNGNFRSYVVSNTYAEPGNVRQLSPENFQQLDQLLAKLPEDNSQLPPAGNRIVLQVLADGQWRVRVYDGSNLPPEVKAVLSLLAKPAAKLF